MALWVVILSQKAVKLKLVGQLARDKEIASICWPYYMTRCSYQGFDRNFVASWKALSTSRCHHSQSDRSCLIDGSCLEAGSYDKVTVEKAFFWGNFNAWPSESYSDRVFPLRQTKLAALFDKEIDETAYLMRKVINLLSLMVWRFTNGNLIKEPLTTQIY